MRRLLPFKSLVFFLFVVLASLPLAASATHIAGGELNYRIVRVDTPRNSAKAVYYEISLRILVDCHDGGHIAIEEDNSAFYSVYEDGVLRFTDSLPLREEHPVVIEAASCNSDSHFCYENHIFIDTILLPYPAKPYLIVWQRCCRNTDANNLVSPSNSGITLFCTIPASTVGFNNSAVYKDDIIHYACIGEELVIPNGATDIDGDSLTYEFVEPLIGGRPQEAKPFGLAPPYTSVNYEDGFSYNHPFGNNANTLLDPQSGLLTVTPNDYGAFQIAVACHEWRKGANINTIIREIQVLGNADPADTIRVLEMGPNPFDNSIHIAKANVIGAAQLRIWDMRGAMVMNIKLKDGEYELDLSTLARGIYIFEYIDDAEHTVRKMLKQR